jgi:DNA-binding NarL/FixJ family response regulator
LAETRILLVDLPQMLRDIVRETASEQGARVVAEFDGSEGVAAIRRFRPDLVISSGASTTVYDELIAAPSRLRVLVVRDDGRKASLYRLRPDRVSLGEVSSEDLAQVIRASTNVG